LAELALELDEEGDHRVPPEDEAQYSDFRVGRTPVAHEKACCACACWLILLPIPAGPR